VCLLFFTSYFCGVPCRVVIPLYLTFLSISMPGRCCPCCPLPRCPGDGGLPWPVEAAWIGRAQHQHQHLTASHHYLLYLHILCLAPSLAELTGGRMKTASAILPPARQPNIDCPYFCSLLLHYCIHCISGAAGKYIIFYSILFYSILISGLAISGTH
jgi:hypothetical protein